MQNLVFQYEILLHWEELYPILLEPYNLRVSISVIHSHSPAKLTSHFTVSEHDAKNPMRPPMCTGAAREGVDEDCIHWPLSLFCMAHTPLQWV